MPYLYFFYTKMIISPIIHLSKYALFFYIVSKSILCAIKGMEASLWEEWKTKNLTAKKN